MGADVDSRNGVNGARARLPDDEPRRLAALRRYDVLDTPPERAFDELTELASKICGTPIALVSLVDADRQWFKSRVGLDATQTPRDVAFCAHAILDDEPLVVPDAAADPRFADNPLVTGAPDIRFYAGAPLVTNDGQRLGTLCVIDRVPRNLDPLQLRTLRVLGRQVVTQLEMRITITRLQRSADQLGEERQKLERSLQQALRAPKPEGQHRSTLSNLSHELRTPLNAIIGLSDILLVDAEAEGSQNTELRDDLKLINDAGNHMLELVNGLLQLAAFDADAVPHDPEPVNVRELVDTVLALIRPLAQRGGNILESSLAASVKGLVTDGTKLRQILINILGNACNYTQDGNIALHVTSVDDATRVRFEITDTGVGMSEEQVTRLYERFARFTTDHPRPTQGTGLGMAITKTLCDHLGAKIQVQSALGRGTRFLIELPVHAVA